MSIKAQYKAARSLVRQIRRAELSCRVSGSMVATLEKVAPEAVKAARAVDQWGGRCWIVVAASHSGYLKTYYNNSAREALKAKRFFGGVIMRGGR